MLVSMIALFNLGFSAEIGYKVKLIVASSGKNGQF